MKIEKDKTRELNLDENKSLKRYHKNQRKNFHWKLNESSNQKVLEDNDSLFGAILEDGMTSLKY